MDMHTNYKLHKMKKTVLTIGVLAFVTLGLTSCGGGEKSNETKPTKTESHEGHDHDAHKGHDHDSHEGHDHGSHEGHNH